MPSNPPNSKYLQPTFRAWANAKGRCYTTSDKGYRTVGGRGIRMIARWRDSFDEFVKDMGECPKGLLLVRLDQTKDYSPENCRWGTRKDVGKALAARFEM